MKLLAKRSKKVEQTPCSCEGNCNVKSSSKAEATQLEAGAVKILGTGCAKCNQHEEATMAALEELAVERSIEHITDFRQIASYGVMQTPALVIDGKVISYGKVLTSGEGKKVLQKLEVS